MHSYNEGIVYAQDLLTPLWNGYSVNNGVNNLIGCNAVC